MTPSFTKPTPEDGRVLDFAGDIWMGKLTATGVLLQKWLTPSKAEVPRESEMEATLARLAPGHPMLAG